jgi:hypothetical protein
MPIRRRIAAQDQLGYAETLEEELVEALWQNECFRARTTIPEVVREYLPPWFRREFVYILLGLDDVLFRRINAGLSRQCFNYLGPTSKDLPETDTGIEFNSSFVEDEEAGRRSGNVAPGWQQGGHLERPVCE